MNTNLQIATTDEERLLIGQALGTGKMVTRKELREEIERHVEELKRGAKPQRERDAEAVQAPADEPVAPRPVGVREFVPSRGDEEYLYQPKDPELAAFCRAVLDGLEYIEEYAWEALERNRV